MRGATPIWIPSQTFLCKFQSTLPMRGATTMVMSFPLTPGYFNPHSPCGERRRRSASGSGIFPISIHTPHAGSDNGGRWACGTAGAFQSTLPMRGATRSNTVSYLWRCISIHTPHAGSDSKSYRIHIKFKNKIYDIRNKNKL